jgi:hypothetical protein
MLAGTPRPLALARRRRFAALPSGASLGPQALPLLPYQPLLPFLPLAPYSPSLSPCARKNDKLSRETVRSTLFSFTPGVA